MFLATPADCFLPSDSFRNTKKSIGIDNHTKFCDRLLLISVICRLIGIDFYRQRSIFIEYRNYRHVTSWVKKCHSILVTAVLQKGSDHLRNIAVAYFTTCTFSRKEMNVPGPGNVSRVFKHTWAFIFLVYS